MVIVDTALEKREREGNPIRVGLVGAGYMGRGIALQILSGMVGMRLVAVCSRRIAEAERAYAEAGVESVGTAETVGQLEDAIARRKYTVTEDAMLLCRAGNIDAIIDASCDVDFGALVTLEAIQHHKHVIMMNAELDSTVGPILKVHADKAGVVLTYADGDEPGVAMNLFRFVKTIGYKPVLMGQIKGFLDRYRNPDTQKAFAEKHRQKPAMVASYADGSKLCIESVLMANATGFKPAIRGMHGYKCGHVKDLLALFSREELLSGGIVDFALGAEPHTGAFVVGYNEHPVNRQYMNYFKMGEGPFYMFYTPFHLPHLQISLSVARAVLFHDPTLTPLGRPVCDTAAFAKRDLKVGEVLDGMGGFTCYGLIDTYEVTQELQLLPMVLSGGCVLKRNIPKDQAISYADVELPAGRLADRLRAEQAALFPAGALVK